MNDEFECKWVDHPNMNAHKAACNAHMAGCNDHTPGDTANDHNHSCENQEVACKADTANQYSFTPSLRSPQTH